MTAIGKRIRVYADASVYGGAFDEGFDIASKEFFAAVRADSGDMLPLSEDPGDVGFGTDLHAEFAGEFRQRDRYGACAAHRIPDALVRLHVGDAAEHCWRAIGR